MSFEDIVMGPGRTIDLDISWLDDVKRMRAQVKTSYGGIILPVKWVDKLIAIADEREERYGREEDERTGQQTKV